MAKSRVLLATGDEWIANLIGAVLRDANLEVVEQPTGAASLEMLERDPVEAVVVDAALPDDAAEFVGHLRRLASPASAAVVLLLAHADDSFSRMEALRAGADACLGRPFRADELGLQVLALIAMAHRCADAPRPRGSFPTLSTALRTPSLPPATSTAALMGDLAQVSLPTMLSLLELERRSGTMTVQGPKQTATLSMREGAAVRATLNGSPTSIIAVLRRVLRLKTGRFEFRPDDPGPASVPPHEQHSSIGALLIEAARLDDESPSRRSSMLPPPPPPPDEPEISFDVHEAPTSPTQLPVIEVPVNSRRTVRPSAPPARRPPGVAAAPSSPPPSRRPSKVPPAKAAPTRVSTPPKASPAATSSRHSKPPLNRLPTMRSAPAEVPDRIPNARVPAIAEPPAAAPTLTPAGTPRPNSTPRPAPRPPAAPTVMGVVSPLAQTAPASPSAESTPADGAAAPPVSGPPRPVPRPGPPRPRGA